MSSHIAGAALRERRVDPLSPVSRPFPPKNSQWPHWFWNGCPQQVVDKPVEAVHNLGIVDFHPVDNLWTKYLKHPLNPWAPMVCGFHNPCLYPFSHLCTTCVDFRKTNIQCVEKVPAPAYFAGIGRLCYRAAPGNKGCAPAPKQNQ